MRNSISLFAIAMFVSFASSGCATAPVPERFRFLNYQGHVNEHEIVIYAPVPQVYSLLTDFDTFETLVPSQCIRVTKVAPGPLEVGTVTCTETGYRIKLRWHSKVVVKEANRMMVLQFQDGIFSGGYEIWGLQSEGLTTRVSHTIIYNIRNPAYRLLWTVKNGESKHNALVEATLLHLKQLCEGSPAIENALLQ